MSDHTKGPWISRREIEMVCWDDQPDGYPFPTAYVQSSDAQSGSPENICYVDWDTDEAESNLRLILAAPLMLDALECARVGLCAVGVKSEKELAVLQEAMDIVSKAINAATGKGGADE